METFFQLCVIISVLTLAYSQDDFQDTIVCFDCFDKAENTTCGYIEPLAKADEIELPTLQCKRGACVKWTFYRNHVLMMRRTCSLKIDLHVALNGICRTERNGNGYLCMCSEDLCNSQTKLLHSLHLILLVPLISTVVQWV